MGRIETFEHTADVGLRIWGETLADLLTTAAGGLFDYIVVNRDQVRPMRVDEVTLQAESTSDLLAGWLSELIYRTETEHRLFGRFEVTTGSDDRSLHALIWGEPIDPARHELDHEVKAVTHHGLITRQEADGTWFAELILDI